MSQASGQVVYPTSQTPASLPALKNAPSPVKSTMPKKIMSVSLKNPSGQEDKKQNIVKTTMNIITPFSQSELNTAWKKYAETLREKLHLKHTMLNNLPVLKENYHIEVLVYNPQQEQALNEEAISLMEFLRKELKNTSIQMIVSVTEENTKKLAYTDKEKFDLMSSMNNNLNDLVKEFKLKLD